jgi:hypothetical protein
MNTFIYSTIPIDTITMDKLVFKKGELKVFKTYHSYLVYRSGQLIAKTDNALTCKAYVDGFNDKFLGNNPSLRVYLHNGKCVFPKERVKRNEGQKNSR